MITPREVELVQRSFAQVVPIADAAAELFYDRLFEIDPGLRSLFKGDMQEQGRKLMRMLALATNGLSTLDALMPAVQELGRRHAGYGVLPQHYESVGVALLWTLDRGLAGDFTPEVAHAWGAAYALLVQTMINAAERAAA